MREMLLLLPALLLTIAPVQAAELFVISTGAVQRIERPMAEEFGAANGHEIHTTAGPMARVRAAVEAGDPADILIVSNNEMEGYLSSGFVVRGSVVPVGHIGIGVAVREGAPQPDISTVENFRTAMLAADSLIYMDPDAAISSGIAMARIFDELGIADEIAQKASLRTSGLAAEGVVSGEAELAIQNMTQLMSVEGAALVGPLPADIQVVTTYVAAVTTASANKEAASAFIAYLTRPEADEIWRGIGILPGAL